MMSLRQVSHTTAERATWIRAAAPGDRHWRLTRARWFRGGSRFGAPMVGEQNARIPYGSRFFGVQPGHLMRPRSATNTLTELEVAADLIQPDLHR
jgi:hypothetical protein